MLKNPAKSLPSNQIAGKVFGRLVKLAQASESFSQQLTDFWQIDLVRIDILENDVE